MRRQPALTDPKLRQHGSAASAPTLICSCVEIPIKTPAGLSQSDPDILVGMQGPQNSRNNLKKKKAVGVTCPIQTYCRATEIKAAWHWPKDRQACQWNGIESPEINIRTHSQSVSTRTPRRFEEKKNSLFNNWC